jgi:branched-chain amino acid aminotransferase
LSSSHDYIKDKRNANIKIYINGYFYPRNKASISVFDSGFLLGDGVWSGIRLHNQKLLFIKEHLKRLNDDAKQIGLKIHLSKKELEKAIYKTTKINKMKSDVHIRLVVSRGIKSTPYQDPAFTIGNPTIVIIPEYKKPQEKTYKQGIKLTTVRTIRGPENVQDPKLNSLSKLNCILACIEAKNKKFDEALMKDPNGNIATCNSTHFFYIKDKKVYTSTGKYCVRGITRQNVINICKKNKIPVYEKNFKLRDVLTADEAFVTGTFANIIPVNQINNKKFKLEKDSLTIKIRDHYLNLINK